MSRDWKLLEYEDQRSIFAYHRPIETARGRVYCSQEEDAKEIIAAKQLINFLKRKSKADDRELKMLRNLYRAIIADQEARRRGHNHKMDTVQKLIERYEDNFSPEGAL